MIVSTMFDQVEQPKPWLAHDINQTSQWVRPLTYAEKAGLRQGLKAFVALNKPLEESSGEDFPFQDIKQLIQDINHQLYKGFGIIVLKEFPIEGLDEESIKKLYWGFTNHLGVLRPQGKNSALMNHVKNVGGVYRAVGGRGYNTNAELDFHVDFADFVGLLCIRDAKEGGISKACSSRALFETLKQQSPHLAEALLTPLYYGQPTLHEYMERTAWHAGQHLRQLELVIKEKLAQQPEPSLSDNLFKGLPMPHLVWDDQLSL